MAECHLCKVCAKQLVRQLVKLYFHKDFLLKLLSRYLVVDDVHIGCMLKQVGEEAVVIVQTPVTGFLSAGLV